MSDLEADIWSDVMCPWCAVGYASFARAVEMVSDEVDVTVRFMPFELNPDLAPEGKPQAAHLAEVYGRTPAQVAQMAQEMAARARRAGFAMDYEGAGEPPEAMMWNTHMAHCLLRWALAEAGPAAQARLKLALFAAHFRQRRNMADREALLDIAAGAGFDRAAAAAALADEALSIAVRLDERRGAMSGITAVPTFVINGRYILEGAQEAEAFARALRQIASIEAAA